MHDPIRLPRPLCAALLLAAAGALGGCGGASAASKPVVTFPTAAEVSRIPSKKPPEGAFRADDALADQWTFGEPPASGDAAYADSTPWGPLLSGLVQGRPELAPSAAMRCAASEVARFHASHHALPAEGLRRFMVARCGGTAPIASPYVWYVEAPAQATDAEIAKRAVASLGHALDGVTVRGRGIVGAAAARDGTHVAVVAMVGDEGVRVTTAARTVDASGHVALEGVPVGRYEQIATLVNRGDAGVATCVDAPGGDRFAATCEVAPGDAYAWVQVMGRQHGQVLMTPLADVLVYRGDPAAVEYQAHRYGLSSPVHTPAELASALERGVNGVRAAHGLAPVALSPTQSAENERLAGTLLDATVRGDDATANEVTIGLLAGWQVSGLIRDANVFFATVGATRDAETWLELALERPIGRATLLDPDARTIAIGPSLLEKGEGIGATVTTYALFADGDDSAAATRFYQRLAGARQALGHRTSRLPAPSDAAAELDAVRLHGKEPMAALQELLASVANNGQSVHGWIFEATDLDRSPLPPELLSAAPAQAIVAVTHHRAEGAAWGQYAVFVLYVGDTREAAAPTRVRTAATHVPLAE